MYGRILLQTACHMAACRGRTPLREGEGRVSWADSTAGGRGPRVVGGLHCQRERAAYRGRTPLPEGEGRVSWADSTAGGRGPRVVGELCCRREMAECHGRTPLPEGEGRVSWEDSTAGGRGPSVGRIFCCLEESQVLLEKRLMDKDERRYQPERSVARAFSKGGGDVIGLELDIHSGHYAHVITSSHSSCIAHAYK